MYERLKPTLPRTSMLQSRLDYRNLAAEMLVKEEERGDFDALVESYRTQYRPGNFIEDICLVEAVSVEWRLRRARHIMSALVEKTNLASLLNSSGFRQLQRYEDQLTKHLTSALRRLKALKKKAGLLRQDPPGVVSS